MNADCLARRRVGDYAEDLLPFACFVPRGHAAVDADGHLAASAECGEGGAFSRHGVPGCLVIEKRNRTHCHRFILARFNSERALSLRGTEMMWLETLADPFRLFE